MKTTDKNGIEIMAGDTLKIYHFTGARRKKHYMYKYVEEVVNIETCQFFKISHLNLSGGSYLMKADGQQHLNIEIVQGYSNNGLPFDARRKENKHD